ncbi:MAG: ornithine cyclodeaminase family protein [Salinarimonadaceae bacterium]|nr:MAG: ornithine cyclodeaminase family protein [Salinarimonadaceae bacterium]
MRVVSADEIDSVLTSEGLVDALQEAFAGDLVAPVRHHHEITRGAEIATLLLMPAWTGSEGGGEAHIGVKIVTVFPENATRSLPSILGSYLLMDGATGVPRAALDGARLTLWRTACASALAARHLAREDARVMTMVGAGALAPFLIRAHMSQRPIDEVRLWNHRSGKARDLAAALRDQGLPVTAVDDLEAAVRGSDLVSCATLAEKPIVSGAWLREGAHLDLVGAFNLRMREADDEALRRSRIFVDTPAALKEGGDVALGIASGVIGAGDVQADLHQLCRGERAGRGSYGEITLFKSVGAAIEDLAAAALAYRRLG